MRTWNKQENTPVLRQVSVAILVEVLLVFAFAFAAIAVTTQLLCASLARSQSAVQLDQAVLAVESQAARFADNPTGIETEIISDNGLIIKTIVSDKQLKQGCLCEAKIKAYAEEPANEDTEAIYAIDVASYQPYADTTRGVRV